MAWRTGIWALIGTVSAAAAGPLRTPRSDCIAEGSYCMDSIKPCCQPDWLTNGHNGHYERICFVFGQGLCQPFYDIPHVELYAQLVRKWNGTNYMELRRAYRQKVDHDPVAELTDAHIIKTSEFYNERTIDVPHSRSFPSAKQDDLSMNHASSSWTRMLKFPTQNLAHLEKTVSSKKKTDTV
ncbi:Cys1 [Hyposoter didymator ichnovirus]|nr:Cys1 [Hyposoter didymator ichnovirus]